MDKSGDAKIEYGELKYGFEQILDDETRSDDYYKDIICNVQITE